MSNENENPANEGSENPVAQSPTVAAEQASDTPAATPPTNETVAQTETLAAAQVSKTVTIMVAGIPYVVERGYKLSKFIDKKLEKVPSSIVTDASGNTLSHDTELSSDMTLTVTGAAKSS